MIKLSCKEPGRGRSSQGLAQGGEAPPSSDGRKQQGAFLPCLKVVIFQRGISAGWGLGLRMRVWWDRLKI